MGRYLLLFIALIWMAGVGAFFLYVPLLSVVSAALVLTGFAVMFVLGVHIGSVASIETELLEGTEMRRAHSPAAGVTPVDSAAG
jgi:hypothetical protein